MRLSRPFASHHLAPSPLRSVVQVAEAGLLFALFGIVKELVARFLFGSRTAITSAATFGVYVVGGALVGGLLYAILLEVAVRLRRDVATPTRVMLALLSGALSGALLSLRYWRRTPDPREFSHVGFTLLGAVVGMLMALILGAIVQWQNRMERVTRVI